MSAIDSFQGDFRFLSNFYPCPVVLEGVLYSSVEHAYVAAKSSDPAFRAQVARTEGANAAKKLGRKVKLRPDWEQVKVSVMESLLRQKFSFGSDLAMRLQSTGKAELVEGNWWGDTFWGVCKGRGLNTLGKLLMKVRQDNFDEVAFWG